MKEYQNTGEALSNPFKKVYGYMRLLIMSVWRYVAKPFLKILKYIWKYIEDM